MIASDWAYCCRSRETLRLRRPRGEKRNEINLRWELNVCHHVSGWNASRFYVCHKMTICRGGFIYIYHCRGKPCGASRRLSRWKMKFKVFKAERDPFALWQSNLWKLHELCASGEWKGKKFRFLLQFLYFHASALHHRTWAIHTLS